MSRAKRDRRPLCALGARGMIAAVKCVGRQAERESKAVFSISGPTMSRRERIDTAQKRESRYRVFARHLRRAANSFDDAADSLQEGRQRFTPPPEI